jgi:hypothetical protein
MTEMSGQTIRVPSKERELRDWRFEIVDTWAGVVRVVRRYGKTAFPVMSSPQPQQQEIGYAQISYGENSYGEQNMGLGMHQHQQQEGGYRQYGLGPKVYRQQTTEITSIPVCRKNFIV